MSMDHAQSALKVVLTKRACAKNVYGMYRLTFEIYFRRINHCQCFQAREEYCQLDGNRFRTASMKSYICAAEDEDDLKIALNGIHVRRMILKNTVSAIIDSLRRVGENDD